VSNFEQHGSAGSCSINPPSGCCNHSLGRAPGHTPQLPYPPNPGSTSIPIPATSLPLPEWRCGQCKDASIAHASVEQFCTAADAGSHSVNPGLSVVEGAAVRPDPGRVPTNHPDPGFPHDFLKRGHPFMFDYTCKYPDGTSKSVSQMPTEDILLCLSVFGIGRVEQAVRERLRIELLIRQMGMR
jgi:hypothetical protein